MPIQHKNSEFILLATYGLATSMEGATKLKALVRFMEEKNIDVIQFDSCVKVGCQGAIDINNLNSEDEIYNALVNTITDENGNERDDIVHTIPYSDYMIQTATPEHYIDAAGIFGTQFRRVITADLEDDIQINVNGKTMTKQQWYKHYQELITENILQAFIEIDNIFSDPKEVEKVLLDEIKSNPRYGRDLINACTLDKDGKFNLPLFDPVQSLRIQQLLQSIIRSRITKQSIKGGSVIQVSNFGFKELIMELKYAKGPTIQYFFGTERALTTLRRI